MNFTKEFLREEAMEANSTIIDLVDSNRWSLQYSMIFEYEGRFYKTGFSRGATESQDEKPFEYADDVIECEEVHLIEKIVKVWEPVKHES